MSIYIDKKRKEDKMRAIKITQPGTAEVLQLINADMPQIQPDEILIDVKAAGINRPDIVQRQGFYPAPAGASELPGLEVAGVVAAVGSNVQKHKLGAKVCALLAGGGYAEFASCHQDLALPMPQGLSFIEAACIPETFFTVWSNLFDQCEFKSGETVLIHGGTSGIGVCAIQLVKAFGGIAVITAGSKEKCDFAKKIGADFTINYTNKDFVEETLNFTQNRGADIILDIIGGDYVNRNYKVAAPKGRIAQIAFLKGNLVQINLNYIMRKMIVHTGSTLRSQPIAFKSAIAKQLFEKVWPLLGNKTITPIIDKIFPITEVQEAHRYMESNKHKGKIALNLQNN